MAIQFETEWIDSAALNGPELSATWASLRIRVDDAIITRLVDRADTVRSQVYVPLYPLAEFLVTNWWFLLHEIENPVKSSDRGFQRRHALMSARDGYAFPNLQVMPAGRQMHLIWMSDRLQWSQIEFLEQGQAWIDREEFRECCSDLVQRVVKRLASLGVEGTLLQEEWASIQTADQDEVTFCETAAGLGWDPYAIGDAERTLISKLEESLTQDWFKEALAVLDVERLDAQVAAIAAVLKPRKCASLALERLRSIHPAGTETGWRTEKPWTAGYALARHVRQELALDGIPLSTTPNLAQALGEDPQTLRGATRARNFGAADLVNGVVTQDSRGLPAFAVRGGSDSARRFHFCRGLAEVLAASNSDALLTRARSDRQQWSRAFAAEFLAPSAALQTRVSSGSTLDQDGVDELAAEFGVSPWLIAHQVRNHGIAEVRQ